MKINRLEAHDRYKHLINDQSEAVQKGAEDCLKTNPDSLWYQEKSPYVYIFGHARTTDDGLNKKIFWQPRLTKPTPQSNSFLFRAQSKTDNVEICWILPPEEFWGQYKEGNVIDSDIVAWSIHQYRTNKKDLGKPFKDDLLKHQANKLLLQRAKELEEEGKLKRFKKSMGGPNSLIQNLYGFD